MNEEEQKKKLSTRQRLRAIFEVSVLSYRAAPLAMFMQLAGALIDAILPIVTTYFAALTTTALGQAFAGTAGAGKHAIAYVIITSALGVLMTGWGSLQQYINQLMRYRIEAAVTDRMYDHFHRIDFWRYDDKKTIDMFDRASQFARFFPYIFDRLANVLTQFITMVAGLVAMVLVSWWLGLILIIAVLPGIFIQFRLSRAQAKHWSNNVETRRAKSMIEWDILNPAHMAELRLYGVIRHLLDMRLALRDKDERARIDFERQYIFKRFGADILQAAAEVVALLWTTFQIIAHRLPIGQFLYVQQIVSRIMNGASGFVGAINSIDEDLVNLIDYQEFMSIEEPDRHTASLTSVPDSIEISDVSFRYPQATHPSLEHISLSIKKGQRVAIVGENGAGKSTLIKLLTGLYQPAQGAILLDGTPLTQYQIESWHRLLGVLSQDFIVYGFANARDNIRFGDISKKMTRHAIESAAGEAEAREFIEKLPAGFNNYVHNWMEDDAGHKGVELSGGQWQRLALARNFYRDSPIIVLDEPTSAIDALAESRIFNHLFAMKDKTIITISHRLTTVKKADIIYMLADGKLLEQGTHDELIHRRGAYFHMFESQL